jgi:hypothetical protein
VKGEGLGLTLHDNRKEVVEKAQVIHRELTLQGGDRVLEKGGIGRHEHDVVGVEQD